MTGAYGRSVAILLPALLGAAVMSSALPAAAVQPAAPTVWRVDNSRSTLGFRAEAAGAQIQGRFEEWRAVIRFDPTRPETASATVEVVTGSARTGQPDRDALLPTADLMDSRRHPSARFVSRRFLSRGGNRYDVAGDLTLKGVRRQVLVPMVIAVQGSRATATGQLTLDRRTFGVGRGPWADVETLGPNVVVNISIVAARAAP